MRLTSPFDAVAVRRPRRRTDWLDDTHGSTAATAIKLVVNGWVFALTTASAEAIALAQRLGVEPERFQARLRAGRSTTRGRR